MQTQRAFGDGEHLVEDLVDVGRDLQTVECHKSNNEEYETFDNAVGSNREELIGRTNPKETVPKGVEQHENSDKTDGDRLFVTEQTDLETMAKVEEQEREIEQIGEEGGAGTTIDAPEGDEVVVEKDGTQSEEDDERKGHHVVFRIVEDTGADAEGGIDDLGQT